MGCEEIKTPNGAIAIVCTRGGRRDVRAWVAERRGTTAAPRTISNHYGIMHAILASAVADELIEKNPCCLDKTDLPKKVDKDPEFRTLALFSRDEVRKLIDSEEIPFRWRFLYAFLFLTGSRIGELLALTWNKIDRTMQPLGRILISKSYSTKNDKITETKTRVSREVPIHERLAPFLDRWSSEEYRAYTGRDPEPEALVFPARSKAALKPLRSNVVLHRFHADSATVGLRPRRTHDTRRSFITLACAEDGANRDILQRVTHTRPGDVFSSYREVSWENRCREISKLKL